MQIDYFLSAPLVSLPSPFLQQSSERPTGFKEAATIVFFFLFKRQHNRKPSLCYCSLLPEPCFLPLLTTGLKHETGLSLSVTQNRNCPLDTQGYGQDTGQKTIASRWNWRWKKQEEGNESSQAVKMRWHFLYGETWYQNTTQRLQSHFFLAVRQYLIKVVLYLPKHDLLLNSSQSAPI